jgi:galactokinase
VAARSTLFEDGVTFDANEPGPADVPGYPSWSNYVRGGAAMLRREGVTLSPCSLLIASEIPVGGGVSSSAALEIGAMRAMLRIAGQDIEPVRLALLAQQAEHEYAHSPCGIMDQFIVALGREDHALLLDCRCQEYEHLPFMLSGVKLLVMDTQVKHSIGGGEYPIRRRQCEGGVRYLQGSGEKIQSLRDVTMEMLQKYESRMDDIIFRRCRHVVTEIARTQEAAQVLKQGDLDAFGVLMWDSHASLRDDYHVSCDELDALVRIAMMTPGVIGARMTGGGFGGCAIALVKDEAEQPFREAIAVRYAEQFDRPAVVYATRAADGARVEPFT